MFSEKVSKVRDGFLFLLCCSLPFNVIPKISIISMIGGPMGNSFLLYPTLFLFAYTAFIAAKHKGFFLQVGTVGKFMILYLAVLLASAVHGGLVFPYYDVIANGEFLTVKFGRLLQFLEAQQISYDEDQLMGLVFIVRSFKNTIFQCIYTFFFSYLIFCWYRYSWRRALTVILRSIQVLSVFVIAYAVIEIFHHWGFQWAQSVLVTVNPLFMDIETGMGWYPPLLWGEARLRSLFSEPSYLGMYVAFALPFLCSAYLRGQQKWFNLSLVFLLWLLSFLTYAKTSMALCLSEWGLFFVLYFFCRDRLYFRKCIFLMLAFVLGFSASMWIADGFNGTSMRTKAKSSYTENYVKSNVVNIANEKAGSNSARFSLIRSELRIWEKYPLLGVGCSNRQCYIGDFLTPEERKNGELANCIKEQEKLGMLTSGFPSPCEYSADLAETGIAGTFVKMFPFAVLILGFWRYRKRIFLSADNVSMVAVAVAMVGCLLNGFSNHLTVLYTTWILLGVAFAMLQAVREKEI